MSKNQVKSIALTTLRISGAVLLFAAKAIVYLCIAIAVVGQLLFAEYAQTSPIEESSPIADPWEQVAPTPAIANSIPSGAVLVVEVSEVVQESIAVDVDTCRYQSMTSPELRKFCQSIGVPWRNFHGKNKHRSRAEMLEAIGA